MNFHELFLMTWRKVWILVVGGFVVILLHNFIDALFGIEEAFFFIIVVFVLPIYFLISVVYSLVYYFKNKKSKYEKGEKHEKEKK